MTGSWGATKGLDFLALLASSQGDLFLALTLAPWRSQLQRQQAALTSRDTPFASELSLGFKPSHKAVSEPQSRAQEGQGVSGHEPVHSIWLSDLPNAREQDASQISDCNGTARGYLVQALPLMTMSLREDCFFDRMIFCWYESTRDLGEGGHGDHQALATRCKRPEHCGAQPSGFLGVRNFVQSDL